MTTKEKTVHPKSRHETVQSTEEEIAMTPKKKTKTSKSKTVHAHTIHPETAMSPSIDQIHAASTNTNPQPQEMTMHPSIAVTTTASTNTNPQPQETTMSTIATPSNSVASTITPSTADQTLSDLVALVATLSTALDNAETQLGDDAQVFTSDDKKRTAKPRKGSDKILSQLAPVVDQYNLNSGSLNTTQMLARYNIAQTLLPLQARLQKMTKRVDDEVFDAQTSSWEMGLQLYALLQRRAKSDGSIAASIQPLLKAFSYRHPVAGKQTKEATRIKANLKKTLAIANKHGVTVSVAPDGGVQSIAGTPAAVQAAQAELATQGVTVAPAATAQNGGSLAPPNGIGTTEAPAGAPAPVATAPAPSVPVANGVTTTGH